MPTYRTTPEKRKATLSKYNNKPERKLAMKKYYLANKYKAKMRGYYRRYGLTQQAYEELLINQKFSCAVCKVHMSETTKQGLCVDHDHKTGQVRGLLCKGCNVALGETKDNVETLKGLIEYVNRFAN